MTFDKKPKLDYVLLLPIVALACYMAFIPHQGYPYPVHVDEWVHLAYSKAMLDAGSVSFANPFTGKGMIGLSFDLEAGFHLFWGIFQRISGLSWLTIFKYFPAILFVMTVLSVYVLGRRLGFGWEAAFFTCLIPTTVGILGPGFLVPVAMGLFFVPLCIFLAFNFRNPISYVLIFAFTCFLLSIHAPSAICLVIILIPYILLNLKGNFRHSIGLTLALVIPFLAPFPWIFNLLLPTARALFIPQPLPAYVDFPRIIPTYGYIPTAVCLLGTFVLAFKGGRKNYALALGLLLMVLVLAVFFSVHYGVPIVYNRGLVFMMLMMSIVAGAGLVWLRAWRLPVKLTGSKVAQLAQHLGTMACIAVIALTLFVAIPSRQSIPYYHMIDDRDYEAFIWVKENVGPEYEKAILDPWKATAFVALTGKKVFTRIHAYPTPEDTEAYSFLGEGCTDTAFLKENGISIVYSRSPCRNPDLRQVREGIYLLEEAGPKD